MKRRSVSLALMAGGFLWQLSFALIPTSHQELFAKLAFAGWIVAFIGASYYVFDFLREIVKKR